jgi:predicted O-methyltransferase YrrM
MAYRFREDWFSEKIHYFQRFLGEFVGSPVNALEIGTYEGRSATWLLSNVLTHPQAKLLCIDAIEQPVLRHNLWETGAGFKAEVQIGASHEILRSLSFATFDFAYLDGSHWSCDVLEDAVAAFRLIKSRGLIAFDDYLWDDPKYNQHGSPKLAVDSFLACYAHKVKVIEHSHQVWIRKLID